jgi:hypothetical protein
VIFRRVAKAAEPSQGKDEALRCSFCNKSQRDVAKLIAGPAVHICDECVAICLDIIAEDFKDERSKRFAGQPLLETGEPGDCTFCGIRLAPLELPKGTVICTRCLVAMKGRALQPAP